MRQLIKRLTSRLQQVVHPVVVTALCVLLVGGIALLLISREGSAHSTHLSGTHLSSSAQTLADVTPTDTTAVTIQSTATTIVATVTTRASTVAPTPTHPPTATPLPKATPSPTPIPLTQETFTCASATPEQSMYHQYFYLIHICLHTNPPQPGANVTNLISNCGASAQSSTGVTLDASGAADYTYNDWLSCAPPTTYSLTAQTNGISYAPCGECTGARMPLSGSVSFNIP